MTNVQPTYPRGAEWRKWDLHIHTKGTQKNDNFTSASFDDFCVTMFQKALKNDISAIGITDYFNLDNYRKIKSFIDNIDKNISFDENEKIRIKNTFLLPNVELRILPATGSGSLINIHCLFNPDKSFLVTLENDFFGSLETAGGHKMNKSGIISSGKSLEPNLDDQQAYRKGIECFHLDTSKLISLFDAKPSLKDNCIIAVANSSHDGASALQEHYKLFENENGSLDAVRRSIYKLSDAIFSGNPTDREFFLGEKKGINKDAVIHKCGSLKPCIHGSDAHTEDELFNPDKGKFCWIKSNTTFEGLKQIICEPNERVRIQTNKPEEKSGYQVIESISVDHDNCRQTILLNSNLNTIIGGRSTGKSTLLKLIAHAIDPSVGIDEAHIRDMSENNTEVNWQDGEKNKSRDIEFFKQSHMYEIARDQGKKDKLIESIVRGKDTSSILDAYENFCSSNKSTIQTNLDDLFEIQAEQNQRKSLLKEKGDKEGLEKEIKSIESKIKDVHSDTFTPEDLINYEEIKKHLLAKEQLLKQAKIDINEIQILKEENLFDQSFAYKFNELSDETSKTINKIYSTIKENALNNWKSRLTETVELINKDVSQLQQDTKDISNNESYKKGELHKEKNKQYSELSDRLKIERKKLEEILSVQKQVELLEKQKKELFSLVVNNHNNYVERISSLVLEFNLSHDDIEISIEKIFRKDKCMSLFHDFINLQSNSNRELVENWTNSYVTNGKQLVENFLTSALNGSITLKSYKDIKDLTKGLLTENWFSVSYKLTYQNDTFEKMSDGKKAFVVLKLLLEFSDKQCPILIDQPEDSLDNRAIYNELVSYLKQKKKSRQIILATHNANIVVNADAEQVIVCNQHGDGSKNRDSIKFQYISGGIESTMPKIQNTEIVLESQGIREHICEILEGGTDAFEKREHKYAIRRVSR